MLSNIIDTLLFTKFFIIKFRLVLSKIWNISHIIRLKYIKLKNYIYNYLDIRKITKLCTELLFITFAIINNFSGFIML